MNEPLLRKAVEAKAQHYSNWFIGVTDDIDRASREEGNPTLWYDWAVDSEQVARNVEAYSLDKGMKRAPGSSGKAEHVYIRENINWDSVFLIISKSFSKALSRESLANAYYLK